MSRLAVYLKPFIDDLGSGYVADWVDVTKDVVSLGSLTQQLDQNEYDLGVFKSGQVKLTLQNDHGRYGDVGSIETIFKYKRGNSLVKVEWEPGNQPLIAGFFRAGHPDSIVSEPVTVFQGLLSDIGTQSDIDAVTVEFEVLGYEQLLSEIVVPYSSISNGDTLSAAIYAMLNQAPFNARVTVSSGNIVAGVGPSVTIDDKTKLENKTVVEALKMILLGSNSVLYIRDDASGNPTVYVTARTASADLEYTFRGPGATSGIESTADVKGLRTGAARILNFWTWKDTTLAVGDASSRAKYGDLKKEISLDIITDNTKRTTCLTSLKDEFANPKREMVLHTPVTIDRLALYLLDKVAVDYPPVPIQNENEPVAIYGVGEFGVDYYADSIFPITIEESARFKILRRVVDFKREVLAFYLREV